MVLPPLRAEISRAFLPDARHDAASADELHANDGRARLRSRLQCARKADLSAQESGRRRDGRAAQGAPPPRLQADQWSRADSMIILLPGRREIDTMYALRD